MRVYVPAVLSDLSVPLPPVRGGVVAVPDAAMSAEDVEVLEDDAITEAALWESSLAWFDRSERPDVLALHQS